MVWSTVWGKFEGHAPKSADFGRFLSVASVAQLAEQLTLNFPNVYKGFALLFLFDSFRDFVTQSPVARPGSVMPRDMVKHPWTARGIKCGIKNIPRPDASPEGAIPRISQPVLRSCSFAPFGDAVANSFVKLH
jgi:hypothetical protein